MPLSLLPIFTALVLVTAWGASAVFLTLALKERKNHAPAHGVLGKVLWHWSLALFLIAWIRIPSVLATFGVSFVIDKLTPFFAVAFIFRAIAYLLFFRGMAFLIPLKKIWRDVFPLIAFIVLAPAILWLIYAVKLPLPHTGNLLRVFHYTIIIFLVIYAVKLALNPSRNRAHELSRPGFFLFAIGWIAFAVSDFYIAIGYQTLPIQFWFLSIVSSPAIPFGFFVAYTMIMAAGILIAYHRHSDSKAPGFHLRYFTQKKRAIYAKKKIAKPRI